MWRVRKVLIRRVDCRGWAGRAGCQSRPQVSFRARFCAGAIDAVGVGDELFVDGSDRRRFRQWRASRVFAVGEFASVVGAAFGVVAELNDGHDVQGPVDASVAGSREAVASMVTAA